MPRKSHIKQSTSKSSPVIPNRHSVKVFKPNRFGGRELGLSISVREVREVESERYFNNALQSNRMLQYAKNWGDALVDDSLPDDPGPVDGGAFKPVTRWIVLYRTAEVGLDGTHNLTVGDVRDAITGAGTANSNPFILKEMHVWIAPNVVNTHFSGLILTQDDADNGILGGQYSDIAPYGEFVKFRIRFPGEGFVTASSEARSKIVLQLGGSAKWNGVIYGKVESFD